MTQAIPVDGEQASPRNAVISALEIDAEDWEEYCQLRDRIHALAVKRIDPIWKTAHEKPSLTVNGYFIIRRGEPWLK